MDEGLPRMGSGYFDTLKPVGPDPESEHDRSEEDDEFDDEGSDGELGF